MIERFKQKWNAKISDSDRFSTYDSFKSVHQLESFLNTIIIKKFSDTLIRLRIGLIELGVNKRFKRDSFVIKIVPFVQTFRKMNLTSCFVAQPMLISGGNICGR